MAEPAALTSAVDAELLLNTRRANAIRLGAVGFFVVLFVGLGEVAGDARWKTDLRFLGAYFALALGAWLAGRRARWAPLTALAPALVDLPFIYLVQRAQFPTTPSKAGVAGFTLGILITLLISGMLTMRRWQLVLTCGVAAVVEVALQWEAGVSAGAMISAVAVIAVATLLFTYAGSRVQALLVKTSHQEKLASLGQLSAAVGHDLRTPLGAIATSVFVARREAEKQAPPPEKLLKAVGLIERESAACARIVTDLLDYAQERPLELSRVSLPELVAECTELVRKRANVQLVTDVPAIGALTLARDRLRQVLMNLIQNAIEAVPDGRAGRVTIAAPLDGPALVLSVADDGVGLTPEVKARIFEPLFTTKKDGTGLGLAIVDSLVKQQGGTLEVASKVGAGSTFSVRLPC